MEAWDIWGGSGVAAVRLRRHRRRTRHAPVSVSANMRTQCTDQGRPEGKRMFVFGVGFVGQYLSARLREEGWNVSGTCTSVAKKKVLEDMGLNAFVFDASENKLKHLNTLGHATHILISIPPMSDLGDPLLFLQEDLRGMLSSGSLQWLGYLSSTSVYGDWKGAWVDEDSQAKPIVQAAKARLAAEKGWLNLGHDLCASTFIFRLGGIYGPGRSALDTIINQKALSEYQKIRMARMYTARVHVADVYQAIKATFTMPFTRSVYNVVDDDPAPRSEVFSFAEELIEEKWPGSIRGESAPPIETVGTEVQRTDAKGEKRVSNARLKRELGVNLIHPSYKSGLRSILSSLEPPFRQDF